MKELGELSHHSVTVEKPIKIDMSWYRKPYNDPLVAIEIERDKKTVLGSEVHNLIYSSARLKVLITYVKDDEQKRFLREIRQKLADRRAAVQNDEFLVAFVLYYTERGNSVFEWWQGYVLAPKAKGRSQIRTTKLSRHRFN